MTRRPGAAPAATGGVDGATATAVALANAGAPATAVALANAGASRAHAGAHDGHRRWR